MAATTRLLLRCSRIWFFLMGFLIAALSSPVWRTEARDSEEATPAAAKPEQTSAPAANGKKRKKQAPKPRELPELPLMRETISLREDSRHIDFPAAAMDEGGTCWIAFIEHDGEQDVVRLARRSRDASGLETVASISEPGIAHQPAIAAGGDGAVWCFWGQTGEDDVVHLLARSWKGGKTGEIQTLASSAGSDTFADAGTDSRGRVWVTWQSMRAGRGDIYARFLNEDGAWSEEIPVATSPAGEWEPRVAFDRSGGAWVTFDSSAGNEFNLQLARVDDSGEVKIWPIAHSPRYEGRSDIAVDEDGSGIWIAAERGRVRWGLDARGHEDSKGLNAQKEILFGRFDIASEIFTEHPLGPAGEAGAPVNLPTIGLDAEGRPWVVYRYFDRKLWRVAATRFNPETQTWTSRRGIAGSSFGQDRRSHLVRATDSSELWLCWPSDLRETKIAQTAGIFLNAIDSGLELPDATPPGEPRDLTGEPFAPSQATPERPADDRHIWEHDGKSYGLYWGDVHRHTDVSNCRTGFDGCITEHFRYAYDIAKLDFMGTSDHTDVGKIYDPYEWWHNQRLHDVFQAPGRFTSLYVYEREQRWPWGHRNIVFAQRGGPLVYINRNTYRNSRWQAEFPVQPGVDQIQPAELWDILERYGKPVAAISHTGATGMGTDWAAYAEPIDMELETLVEIFQGARVSYEGLGAPQPTVGLRPDETYTANTDGTPPPPPAPIEDFGKFSPGVYQNALALGHRLGVFASSDHISQHVSYGGVYCEEFTREGIIEGFRARRTVAATDKIYLSFTCNGEPLGTVFESRNNPQLSFQIDGTAPLKRVTIVRNEQDWKVFEDGFDGHFFETSLTDESPLDGENRYYLRVEQEDGNMGWASPVWVTVLR